MGLYQHVRELWKDPRGNLGELWQQRLIEWRRENSTTVIEHPTRIDRARSLGFKAKQGFVMIRQRVPRGGHSRPLSRRKGRRSKHYGSKLTLHKNYQQIAEERAQKKYTNLVVLNSYMVAEDGKHAWYEIILVDPHHPVIKADPHLAWLQEKKNQSRVYHGKTSAGRKARGLHNKGKGTEKVRPSRRAHLRRA